MSRRTAALLAACCLGISIAACSTGTTGSSSLAAQATPSPSLSPTAASTDTIAIKGFEFQPARLSVQRGATVTWTNEEDSLHTVTSGAPDDRTGLFDSGEFDTGETYEFTFDEAGAFPFFCDRHEFMRGEIVVAP
jgi:plastocyanin